MNLSTTSHKLFLNQRKLRNFPKSLEWVLKQKLSPNDTNHFTRDWLVSLIVPSYRMKVDRSLFIAETVALITYQTSQQKNKELKFLAPVQVVLKYKLFL